MKHKLDLIIGEVTHIVDGHTFCLKTNYIKFDNLGNYRNFETVRTDKKPKIKIGDIIHCHIKYRNEYDILLSKIKVK